MITVLLVDDQDLIRAGMRALLGSDEDIAIVGEASDGRRGVEAALRHRPDVVLMDIRMPRMGGIEATRAIREDPRLTSTRVVMLTTFDDDTEVVEAIRAGTAGYLLKGSPAAELRDAVHRVGAGENILSPRITTQVMDLLASTAGTVPDPRLALLSEREVDVLKLVAVGDTNNEIAGALHLSPATVRTYVSRILAKLDARDRTALTVIAHRSGLV